MEGDQARAGFFPNIAELAQHLAVIVIPRGRLNAQSMELLGGREFVCNFGETRDDTTAISKHRDRAAFPEAQLFRVGMLQLAEKVIHILGIFFIRITQPFQAGDETRPGAGFQFVEIRCWMFFHFAHGNPSLLVSLIDQAVLSTFCLLSFEALENTASSLRGPSRPGIQARCEPCTGSTDGTFSISFKAPAGKRPAC